MRSGNVLQAEQGILPGVDIYGYDIPDSVALDTLDGNRWTVRYNVVTSVAQLDHMLSVLTWADQQGYLVAWDTETSGLKPELGARIAGHCFAAFTGPLEITGWYVPIRHLGAHNQETPQLAPELVAEKLRPFFSNRDRPLVVYHGKFDGKMARADDLWLRRPMIDIAIEATIDNENEPRFGLKFLADKYCYAGARSEEKTMDDWMRKDARSLGMVYKKYSKTQRAKLREKGLDDLSAPTYMDRFGYARSPIKMCAKYGIHDVVYCLYLHSAKYAYTQKRFSALWEREHGVALHLMDMEWRGLLADEACIRDTHDRTRKAVEHWLQECQRLAPNLLDETFEASDSELRKLFFDDLGMKPPKFTKKGNTASVDKEARKLLEKQYPENAALLQAIGNLATVTKLHTTYAGNYLRFLSPVTKTINPSYNQLERRDEGGVPVTGRLSSADPNNQNVSSATLHLWNCRCGECVQPHEQAGEANTVSIRRYFVVPEGYVRVYLDFSQIELRVLAWFCQDPTMLRAFREGIDLHQLIADELNIKRKVAKQVNFGNSYGMTEIGLALRLPGYYDDPDKTREEARQILDAYFKRYARILAFRREFAALMRRNGNMFTNPFGRPRRIPDISASGAEKWKRMRAERMMMSSIISGTSADLMKESMLRTVPIARDFGGDIVQTIHDELVFDLPRQSGWAQTVLKLHAAMEDWPMFSEDKPNLREYAPGRFGVPIKSSVELSVTNWEDKREIEIVDGTSFRWAA